MNKIIDARQIATGLNGRKVGCDWLARCPAHHDQHPSLSICDSPAGKPLFYCNAGCTQAQVIEALRQRGLWAGKTVQKAAIIKRNKSIKCDVADAEKREGVQKLWSSCVSIIGTLAELYLKTRGIHLNQFRDLRFHPGLKHPGGGRWPALVGSISQGERGSKTTGIHRTFITHDGRGKAPVNPQKMMLGTCRGGAVKLAEPNDTLIIGEGIETCLSVMQATGLPAWAALSTSGLKTLELPSLVHQVIILADGDKAGEVAAQACARKLKLEEREVQIARPPKGYDFNDVLRGTVGNHEKDRS